MHPQHVPLSNSAKFTNSTSGFGTLTSMSMTHAEVDSMLCLSPNQSFTDFPSGDEGSVFPMPPPIAVPFVPRLRMASDVSIQQNVRSVSASRVSGTRPRSSLPPPVPCRSSSLQRNY
ncbi:unnamed protein product [Rodentolepis nana]|uniref:Movement protein n=1 Tax=Rodentolepis nana TaxID=102285 RepID=A0A0R3T903_RODNA|nr:unnamed protein product [Rodentolepis nana]